MRHGPYRYQSRKGPESTPRMEQGNGSTRIASTLNTASVAAASIFLSTAAHIWAPHQTCRGHASSARGSTAGTDVEHSQQSHSPAGCCRMLVAIVAFLLHRLLMFTCSQARAFLPFFFAQSMYLTMTEAFPVSPPALPTLCEPVSGCLETIPRWQPASGAGQASSSSLRFQVAEYLKVSHTFTGVSI